MDRNTQSSSGSQRDTPLITLNAATLGHCKKGVASLLAGLLAVLLVMPAAGAAVQVEPSTPLVIDTPATSSLIPRTGPIRVYFSHPKHRDLHGHTVTVTTTLVNSQNVVVGSPSIVNRNIVVGNYVDVHYDGTVQFATHLELRVSYAGSEGISPTSTSLRRYRLGGGVPLHFQAPRTASLKQSGELVIPMAGYPRPGGSVTIVEPIYMHVTVNERRHTFTGFTNGEYGFVAYSLPPESVGQRAEVVFSMDLSLLFAASSSAPRHYNIVK